MTARIRPPRASTARHAHKAGLDSLAKPPSRWAMTLAVTALIASIAFRLGLATLIAMGLDAAHITHGPAPRSVNPATIIHRGGPWMGPLERCHGTGVYTTHDGRCAVIPAR